MTIFKVNPNENQILPSLGNLNSEQTAAVDGSLEKDKPEFSKTLEAAFRLENTIGSALSMQEGLPNAGATIDNNFDPFDKIQGYEQHASKFVNTSNERELEAVKLQIDHENELRSTLQDAGWQGVVASMAAGVLDPINLLPVGGSAYRTYSFGANVLKGAANTALAGAVGSTATEALLHQSQVTRTYGESATNIAGATVLSGLLGGGVSLVREAIDAGSISSLRQLSKGIESDLTLKSQDEEELLAHGLVPEGDENIMMAKAGSIGAAQVKMVTLKGESIKSAFGFDKIVAHENPVIRTATSQSLQTRLFSQKVAEQSFVLNKHSQGDANTVPIETLIKMDNGMLVNALKTLDDSFSQYKLGRSKRRFDGVRIAATDLVNRGRSEQSLTKAEFNAEVAKAMRRGDVHEIPEVEDLAKQMRSKLFEPMKKRAVELGILPKSVDVKTATSYLTRVYDVEKINAKSSEFDAIVRRWLEGEERNKGLTPNEIADIATQIRRNIVGGAQGRLPYEETFNIPEASKGRGRGAKSATIIKERAFDISDELVEDFLENDIELVAKRFHKTMSADTRIVEKLGTLNMDDIVRDIVVEYNDLLEKGLKKIKADGKKAGKSQEQINKELESLSRKITKARKRDEQDVVAMIERLRGVYALPSNPEGLLNRTSKAILTANYLADMGGVLISSVPDIGKLVAYHGGMKKLFSDGLPAFTTEIKRMSKFRDEMEDLGAVTELVLNNRLGQMADVMDNYGRGSKFERGLDYAASNFGRLSGMTAWNGELKNIAALLSSKSFLQMAERSSKNIATKSDTEKLATGFVDANLADRIHKQFTKHGDKSGKVWLPQVAKWTDKEAAEAFTAGVIRDVDRTIVSPGLETPNFMQKQTAKVIFQYKSFMFGSTLKTTMGLLQQRDWNALQGVVSMVGLGILSKLTKDAIAGREVEDSPQQLIVEGFDRSGVAPWFFEVNNMMEKLSRGTIGVSPLLGQEPMSRYASRNLAGSLMGPTFGKLQNLGQVTGAMSTSDWTEADTRAVRRMLPYQNIWWLRSLLDQVENGINKELGVR